jgi:1-deoxy-D-xylulose-5-phosphate reductoisomerase
MKRISILGSTGSIGKSALQVIERFPERFQVAGLGAARNHALLLEQIKKFKPECAALSDPAAAKRLREKTDIPIFEGEAGLIKVAAWKRADFVLSSIVGFAGLVPTLAAIRAGKTIGLANKEVLVTAGEMVMREARSRKVQILPVDSEHSAIFQCLAGQGMVGQGRESVNNLILTASGGPFAGKTRRQLARVKASDALRHPNWQMGKKITLDSATLMNKGLEVIEAHYLFGLPPEKIKVLVHPQSIVHSMVEFIDGTLLAQLSVPDMKAPIAYALSWPERLPGVIQPLRLARIKELTFSEPDTKTFPCLAYAYRALRAGGTAPAAMNAANEVAVEAFLQGRVGFNDIPAIIKKVMDLQGVPAPALDLPAICQADSFARKTASELIKKIRSQKV